MKKKRWCAGAGERGGDFSSDQAGLAHARDHHAAFAREENVYGFFKGGVEAREHVLDGLGFDSQNAPGGVEAHGCVIREWRAVSTAAPLFFVSVASKRLRIRVSSLFPVVVADLVSVASKGLKLTVGGRLCREGRTGTACRAPTSGVEAGRRRPGVIGRSIGARLLRVL